MRAHGRKYEMGKRFALLIGLAVAGVMALGAQTGAASEGVVSYGTKVTILQGPVYIARQGEVKGGIEVQGWARGDPVQEAARAGSQARR